MAATQLVELAGVTQLAELAAETQLAVLVVEMLTLAVELAETLETQLVAAEPAEASVTQPELVDLEAATALDSVLAVEMPPVATAE